VVDLVVGQNLFPLHEVANEHTLLDRLFADLRCSRVADARSQRGRQRRRPLDPVLAHRAVVLDSLHALVCQYGRRVSEDSQGKQHIERDDRHHHVELELACPGGNAPGGVRAFTWKHTWLTISGIDGLILPGMIEEPGCTAGRVISSMPVRGPMTMRRRSLAILLRSIASTRTCALNAATSPMLCIN